jgi:hypothetical protein
VTAVLDRPVVGHVFEPHGAAKTMMEARDGEVLMAGPAGTGKSRACLEKLHFMCLLNPGMRALILRKTQRSLSSTGLVTFREKVASEGIRQRVLRWFGGSTQEAAGYKYSNGAFVAVGGLDDPLKIMSSEYDLIYIQEATEVSENDWESCTSRLRNGVVSFQQLLADCNPSHENHWLNLRSKRGQTRMLHSRHEDNPQYFRPDGTMTDAGHAYIEGVLDKLTGVRYLRLRKGIWAAAEGLVYEDWDDAVHLIEAMPPGWETWPRYWTVDFGYSNPFVCQFWAQDHDGRLYLYREIYMSQRLVEDHAKHILSLVCPGGTLGEDGVLSHGQWLEPQPEAIICDHDAEDRATLERHLGLGTRAARKAPTAGQKELVGLQAAQARYKVQDDGKPRIFYLSGATVEIDEKLRAAGKPTSTVDEVTCYVWPTDVPPDKRERPVKENDHGMDAKRYLVAEVDQGQTEWLRWVA